MEDLKDSNLISGADALRALADGVKPENIEVRFSNGYTTSFISTDGKLDFIVRHLNEKLFRLKPQTVKVELELPKPFEPKVGEWFYYLSAEHEDGYGSRIMHDDTPRYLINFGAYRTEDEIKQVVEQLRKIKGAV